MSEQSTLTNVQRLKVWAATGMTVALDSKSLWLVAETLELAETYEREADAKYRHALQAFKAAQINLIAAMGIWVLNLLVLFWGAS